MTASELFPSAVVLYDGKYVEVKSPSPDLVHLRFHDLPKHRDELMPAPITPEALERLGFVKKNWGWYNSEGIEVSYDGDFTDELVITRCDDDIVMGLMFIHQLQAIALHVYGEELVWK